MAIKVVELHHHAIRVGPTGAEVDAVRDFYVDVLGLAVDPGRRVRSGIPGHWLDVGDHAQIHLMGVAGCHDEVSGIDASAPHVALAVADIAQARAELQRLGVPHRVLERPQGPAAMQVFLKDPAGNLVELHQAGFCRCVPRSRRAETEGHVRSHGAVMFADMRGFTTLAERLPPAAVVPLLNEYFTVLIDATDAHGGTVYHLAGDGLMAGFGVEPADAADRDAGGFASPHAAAAASHAVQAARRMLAGFGELAGRWKSALDVETGLGVGIHAGEVIAGDVGSRLHRRYTLIGDTVNVAARLGQRARAGEALFSRSVQRAVEQAGLDCPVLPLPKLVVRGRAAPVEIWCIPAGERVDWRANEPALEPA
ncbi:MAG: VOC family protein [Steroidobacteraceae bacterium]|nr:VOC family protein [Steroidobacteraceae bacterium]